MMSPFIGVVLFNLFCVTLNEITSEKDNECRNEAHNLIELEISHTFYIEDCRFVEINFEDHGARKLKFSIISNEAILDSIELKESDGLLADFSTPVHILSSHNNDRKINKPKDSYYSIKQSNIYQFAPGLDYFTFYHNSSRKAAFLYSYHGPSNISLDGNIGNYVLRRLSKIINNNYQYIYVKILDAYQAISHSDLRVSDFLPREKISLEASHIDEVNIKLLVILDLEENYTKTPVELIKTLLMFYNYNNMLFSIFELPSIRLTLKGIVFPKDINTSLNSTVFTSASIDRLKELVEKLTPYFHLEDHDIVTVSTKRLIMLDTATRGFSETMIINEHKICEGNVKPTMIIFRSIDHQAGHGTWLSKIFPMFCNNNFTVRLKLMCPEIVADFQPDYVNVLQLWPSCIIAEYSKYFRDNTCSEFDSN